MKYKRLFRKDIKEKNLAQDLKNITNSNSIKVDMGDHKKELEEYLFPEVKLRRNTFDKILQIRELLTKFKEQPEDIAITNILADMVDLAYRYYKEKGDL